MKIIAIYGASGHAKVVSDIAKLNGYTDIIYIDDNKYSYLSFQEFLQKNLNIPIAFGIGNNLIRAKLYQQCIKCGLEVKTLIHPHAVISPNTHIGEGTVVMANVVINADTHIGKCCIINTSSIIEHDNSIGDYVHISPGVACAGNVKVGKYVHVGINSCIIQGIEIGNYTAIGAGSVVVENIESNVVAYGNPCKKKKEII